MDNPKFMTLPDLVELYANGKDNKEKLQHSTKCGCFHCKKIFDPAEINKWTDDGNTAICPYCGIDSVITKTASYEIVPEVLDVLYKYYFAIAEKLKK